MFFQFSHFQCAIHTKTKETFTVTEFLEEISRRRAARLKSRTIKLEEAPEPTETTADSPAFDAALRLRIKQLETDLASAVQQLDQQSHEMARLRGLLGKSGLSV